MAESELKGIKITKMFKSNKKLKMGLIFLLIAVLLAFGSIGRNAVLEKDSGEIEDDGFTSIERKRAEVYSRLKLEYTDGNGDVETEVSLIDRNYEIFKNVTIESGENKTIMLTELDNTAYFVSADIQEEDSLTYSHHYKYHTQPYSLLALPAFVLTLVGIVLATSGYVEYIAEYKAKKRYDMEEEKEKGKKEEGEHKVIYEGDSKGFMGLDWDDEDDE